MNKKLIVIFSILILAIIAFAVNYFFSPSVKLNPPIFITGAVVTEKGTVIENVTKDVEVDAPAYLHVKKEGGILSGSEIKVVYHTGEAPCVNPIQSAFNIKKGDTIEVRGIATGDDTVSTCESKDYYIKNLSVADSPQQQRAKISTEKECESFRGQWRGDNCVLPATDVGKQCRNDNECQAACIANLSPEEERLLVDEYGKHTFEKIGHCSEFVFGCYARVNNGKVDGILCAD